MKSLKAVPREISISVGVAALVCALQPVVAKAEPNSKCTVKSGWSEVGHFVVDGGIGQAKIEGVDVIVMFNDLAHGLAQVGIDDKAAGSSSIFYTPVSPEGSFVRAISYSSRSSGSDKSYLLNCSAL